MLFITIACVKHLIINIFCFNIFFEIYINAIAFSSVIQIEQKNLSIFVVLTI